MAKTSPPFHFIPIFHAHQPSGNFEYVFEECYRNGYEAFLGLLEEHPKVHAGLHYSGPLLLWIEKNHPDYFERLKKLVTSRQVEILGGGFYEPILISIPQTDQIDQLRMLSGYIEKHFGKPPTGAWLAERIWEPQLPSPLSAANISYTMIDDLPFLAAGFEPNELFGVYIAEDLGKSVWVFPCLKELRYLIPFGKVEDCVAFFENAARLHPGAAAVFGDDMEKFGVWPGTHKHCYTDGWLKEFFTALEENAEWLKTCTPAEYMGSHLPLGRADLPAGSYEEMMEWVLPTERRLRSMALRKEFEKRPDLLMSLRGGVWRGFFRKYPEANLLHKKMLRASAQVASIPPRRANLEHAGRFSQARDHVLRGQGNDAYWHGVFGGLYAPHLRTELWRNLIKAETIADRLTPGGLIPRVELLDYDADGVSELLFTAPEYQVLLKPSDGATLALFDFRPTASTLINSILRRPEASHARLREASAASGTVKSSVSIHEEVRVKELNLERFLCYDRYLRHAFRLLLFDGSRTISDYENLHLGEVSGLASGAYQISNSSATYADLTLEEPLLEFADDPANPPVVRVTKHFLFGPTPEGCEVSCDFRLTLSATLRRQVAIGVESVINLLAPTEPDRFFETSGGPRNLRFSGALPGPVLRVQDGWQRLRVTLHAPQTEEFWVTPIESVSESEGGFERVYQGSQILAFWRPNLTNHTSFSGRLVWRVEAI